MKALVGVSLIVALSALFLFNNPFEPSPAYQFPDFGDDEIIDNSTYANVDQVVTEHLHLDLTLDFNRKIAHGSVTLTMRALIDNLERVILDSRFLDIHDVFYQDGSRLDYWFLEKNLLIGKGLNIGIWHRAKKDEVFNITVHYATTNETLSLNWLDPEQTAGKRLPYVYTHCEAIDCRTLIPLQDTPSVKATYSARIRSPEEIVVRMSANVTSERNNYGVIVTEFSMNVPIPSYLIALAAGNLAYHKIGKNVGVMTEPEMLERSVAELEDLQSSLDLAESFLTGYEWGNYTILIMPPSFPFGGMENPLLTFASPTIIVGDKSQVDVATHEIAHSWTGNLVTNRNWENFWLNEGFTVYTERHVSRKQRGEEFYMVSSALGNSSLFADMEEFGMDSTFSTLHPLYEGHNPYDTFSEVPYEKGYQFLTHIENLIGIGNMEKFLKSYITKYRHHSIVYRQFWETFQAFLGDNFTPAKVKEINDQIDLHAWIHKPGAPPVQLNFSTPNLTISRDLATEYIRLGGKDHPENYEVFYDYFSLLKCTFLTSLVDQKSRVTIPILERIDADYNLTETIDPEQKVLWYQVGIAAKYERVIPHADAFLGSAGRLKYLLPLYK